MNSLILIVTLTTTVQCGEAETEVSNYAKLDSEQRVEILKYTESVEDVCYVRVDKDKCLMQNLNIKLKL